MFDFTNNYRIARRAAGEGIVLLKNENNVLPLKKDDSLAVIGDNCLSLHKGGGGSADVFALYQTTLIDGLLEKVGSGKFSVYKPSIELAQGKNTYTVEELNNLSDNANKAIVCIKRIGTEGSDRYLNKNDAEKFNKEMVLNNGDIPWDSNFLEQLETKSGFFVPSAEEISLFETIEKSKINEVIVLLNIDAIIDLSYLSNFSKIKAIVLTYLPGMEGGNAIADILCADVNPSGKLTDTIALRYSDYPSAAENDFVYNNFSDYNGRLTNDVECGELDNPDSPYYQHNRIFTKYKEDIFVGYRYFETFAKDKVLYPFGFGLSYTKFALTDYNFKVLNNSTVLAEVTVKNTGEYAGKEVIQVYTSSPKEALEHPAIELRGFEKTKLLNPGDSQRISISFPVSNMASFDAMGLISGQKAWVLEKGDYKVFIGTSVRDTTEIGVYTLNENTITKTVYQQNIENEENNCDKKYIDAGINKGISLYDVADKKFTILQFVRQLSVEQLINLSCGQYPDFAKGTSGMGNLKEFGVPNPQTADGPAGLRKSVPTTAFPCPTLYATSWDKDLQFEIGSAMGFEGVSTGVDVLLGPSLNIHRTPLCGRNFEYYSEDPLVSGKTAASIVNGLQNAGLCACLKHFVANNIETRRQNNDSIVGERALREIYLKGFEIAVEESDPAFIMTGYNLVNGVKASTNKKILTEILRYDWRYKGCVMTDWRTWTRIWQEIKAGNNLHMPFGYPDEEEVVLKKYEAGEFTRGELEDNAIIVLDAVMKTNRFKQKNFGVTQMLSPDSETEIVIDKTLGITSAVVGLNIDKQDNRKYFDAMTRNVLGYPVSVLYQLNIPQNKKYLFTCEVRTDCKSSEILIKLDGCEAIKIPCPDTADGKKWHNIGAELVFSKGVHIMEIEVFHYPDKPVKYGIELFETKEKFELSKIKFMPLY